MLSTIRQATLDTDNPPPLIGEHMLKRIENAARRGLGATAIETQAMLAAIRALHLWQREPGDELAELIPPPARPLEEHQLDTLAELAEAGIGCSDPAWVKAMLIEIDYYRSTSAHHGNQRDNATIQRQADELAQARADVRRLERENQRLARELERAHNGPDLEQDLLGEIIDAYQVELQGQANPTAIPDYVADVYRRLRQIGELATSEKAVGTGAATRLKQIATLADVSK